MRAQLAKAGTPAPMVIGIDEISVRKGHTYRIVKPPRQPKGYRTEFDKKGWRH
jgi:hypothetical protein